MSTLERQLAALQPGDHVCLLYEEAAEALAAVVPFIASGLARGERCLYIAGEPSIPYVDQVPGALAAAGVDVRREQERGALALWPTFDAGFAPGEFDPMAMIALQRTLVHDAGAAGFSGLRIVADMTWMTALAVEHDKQVLFEAAWNDFVAANPIAGLCLYPRHSGAPELLRDVLRSHPLVLLSGHLCQNLYYEPPSLVVDPHAVAQRVEWMMAQLLGACRAAEDLQARKMQLEQWVAERTRELTALLAVARSLVSTLELGPLLEQILAQLGSVIDYTGAAVRLVEGEDLVVLAYHGPLPREGQIGRRDAGPEIRGHLREVLRTRAAVVIDDVQAASLLGQATPAAPGTPVAPIFGNIRSWLGVPLLLKERVLGVLSLAHTESGYYTARHAELALAIASHIAVALENARLYQQVQEVAVAEERARIAREMHDSLAQILFYVNTQAEAALTLVRARQIEQAEGQLGQLAQAARDAYADVREDILALRTAGTTHGLVESLTTYLPLWQEQSGVRAALVAGTAGAPLPALPSAVEIQVVRIVQEALANVRKHAHAGQVEIHIAAAEEQITVEVADDGVGFDPALRALSASPHFGLAMMRERAAAVGGRLELDAAPGRGTRVRVRVPVEAAPLEVGRRA